MERVKRHIVGLEMQPEAIQELDRAAAFYGITRSALMRLAIADAVEDALKKEAKRVRQRAQ